MLTKLQDIDTTEVDDPPIILKAEVEAAIKSLKSGKSPGVDNVPGELIKYGGEAAIDPYTPSCAMKSGKLVFGHLHGPNHL